MKSLFFQATIRPLDDGSWVVTCRNDAGQVLRSVQPDLLQAFAGATGVRILTLSHQDQELALLRLARSTDEFPIAVHRRQLTIGRPPCVARNPAPGRSRRR